MRRRAVNTPIASAQVKSKAKKLQKHALLLVEFPVH
jgi:hypothetical protein